MPGTHVVPRLRKAVIPAAGRGTRLLPATAAVPKELLPVRLKPMIQHCLEEAVRSGLEEIAVILSPEKQSIRTFLLEAGASGGSVLEDFGKLLRKCHITFLEQPSPLGVADALLRARDFISDAPFAVLLPDNVCFSPTPPIAQMIPHLEPGLCALALIEYRRETAEWFGNCGRVDCTPIHGPRYRITRLYDKGPGSFHLHGHRSELVGYARYVLQPYFLDFIPAADPAAGGREMDDTPVFQRLIAERGLTGIRISGEAYDAGNPAGYAAANSRGTDRVAFPRGSV